MPLFSRKQTISNVVRPVAIIRGRKHKPIQENVVYYIPGKAVVAPKGKVPQEAFSFLRHVGDPHPENYEENELLSKRTPLISAILKKYANHVIGSGFDIRTDKDSLTEEIREYNKQIQLENVLRKAIIGKKIYGWLPVEILGIDASGLAIRNPKSMFIKRDDKGAIIRFNQYFSNKIQATWEPEQIALFIEENPDDKTYPPSLIETIRTMSQWKVNAEKSLVDILYRKANPSLHFKIGDKDFNPSPTQADIDAFQTELETLTNTTEWVTTWNVGIDVKDTGNIGDKFVAPLEHLDAQIIAAGQVPEVILGRGNIPEGLAKEQREDWNLTIRAEQQALETVVVQQIYAKRWPGKKIDIIWGLPSDTAKQEEVARLSALLQGTIQLTPILRLAIEKRVAKLLELAVEDEDIDMSSEDEKERKDNFISNQQINHPFGRNAEETIRITPEILEAIQYLAQLTPYKMEVNEKLAAKGSIKEAIGWEPHPFKKIILQTIEREAFLDLTYLSMQEKDALRRILKTAIKREWSIPTIAAEIEKRLKKPILNKLSTEFIDRMNAEPNREELAYLEKQIRQRAETIARSEIIRASNESAKKAYEASNIVHEVQWLTARDEKTCHICQPLNLKKFPITESPMPVTDTHPSCRCSILPVLNF